MPLENGRVRGYTAEVPPAAPRRPRARFVAALAATLLLPFLLTWNSVRRMRRVQTRPQPPAAPAIKPQDLVNLILREAPACERAWPGYRPLFQPLLLAFEGRGSLLIGARTRPRGFLADTATQGAAAASFRPFQPAFDYVADFDLDGTTVTALRLSGRADASRAAGFFLHERFHGFQRQRFEKTPWEPYLVESAADVALAGLENRSLARWVTTGAPDAMRDFAALRARRRRLFPGSAAELAEERIEGTARYVELAGVAASSSPAAVRSELAAELNEPASEFALHKRRNYGVGAALCRWLDAEKVPAWRAEVEAGLAPSELVLRSLALDRGEAGARVARLTRLPGYAAAKRSAERGIADLRAARAGWRRHYDALPGLRLVLTSSAAAASFTGDWLDYPDRSSLLVASEWVVERPEIKVRLRDDKGVLRRMGRDGPEAEFVVPPGAVIGLDDMPWTPKPGRARFKTLTIKDARIALSAGPGVLVDDGKYLRLSFPRRR